MKYKNQHKNYFRAKIEYIGSYNYITPEVKRQMIEGGSIGTMTGMNVFVTEVAGCIRSEFNPITNCFTYEIYSGGFGGKWFKCNGRRFSIRRFKQLYRNLGSNKLPNNNPVPLKDMLEREIQCSKCGMTGLHACPGSPMEDWTNIEINELDRVLTKVFGFDNKESSNE